MTTTETNHLRPLGIEVTNPYRLIVHCLTCRNWWSPMLPLRPRWWVCPHNGCNDDVRHEHPGRLLERELRTRLS